MALIKCPECGQEISDKAAICPRCAYPIKAALPNTISDDNTTPNKETVKNQKKKNTLIFCLIAVAAVIIGYFLYIGSLNTEVKIKTAIQGTWSYSWRGAERNNRLQFTFMNDGTFLEFDDTASGVKAGSGTYLISTKNHQITLEYVDRNYNEFLTYRFIANGSINLYRNGRQLSPVK